MKSFKHLAVDDAKTMIEKGDVTIVDVRDSQSYNTAHIDNSIRIHKDNIDQFLSESDNSRPLIVYCYHGNTSQDAANFFFEKGVKDVYSMDGGFEAWRVSDLIASDTQQ
ncbi:MAG: thiosulfate sulfurtransferase GlpE [Proteobacteria bacterium]|nr:thiosulfate sulfurtransferase GlpE [Pseudomonadota bacterium]